MYTSDTRILQVYNKLKEAGYIRFDSDFYHPIQMTRQMFSNIKNQGKHPEKQSYHFTPEHIEKICKVFKIDANYIFGLSETMQISGNIKGNIIGNNKGTPIIKQTQ